MTEEGEVRLVQCVMEDFMNTYDERQWAGLEEMMALSAAGDVAIPELEMTDAVEEQPVTVKEEVHEEQPVATFHPKLVGQRWTWSCTVTEMAEGVGPSLGAHAAAVTGRGGGAGAASAADLPGLSVHLWTLPRTSTSLATMTTTEALENGDEHGNSAGHRILSVF
ncbi:hypothetical protein D1007_46330 [Hordeum vulgare]|nr:hypothetical protein D1007_46330 [Hordeum vulgare]